MITAFQKLTEVECSNLYRVPALITVLIAGADNDIDNNEIQEAISLTQLKKVTSREILVEYYDEVRKIFNEQLIEIISRFPENMELRQHFIIQELTNINEILPKIEHKFAVQLYASIKDFAKKIAEASGGVLGYIPVGYEESKLIELPMIKYPDPLKD